jgi:hypothetical protein
MIKNIILLLSFTLSSGSSQDWTYHVYYIFVFNTFNLTLKKIKPVNHYLNFVMGIQIQKLKNFYCKANNCIII